MKFDMTPEYFTVLYQARAEDREALIDYLAKIHPCRVSV